MISSEIDLEYYYRMRFILNDRYNISLNDFDNMIPFERDIYIFMLNEAEEKKQVEQNK